jgi:hypothetical protein
VKAGYMLSEETRLDISHDAVEKENAAKEKEEKTFTDVYTCREVIPIFSYKNLKKRKEKKLTKMLKHLNISFCIIILFSHMFFQ